MRAEAEDRHPSPVSAWFASLLSRHLRVSWKAVVGLLEELHQPELPEPRVRLDLNPLAPLLVVSRVESSYSRLVITSFLCLL